MKRVEKTVFISYRRTNAPWALAIYQNLTNHGYDVFFDFTGIASGDFETVILENIRARAHFIVLLTPSALERCNEPGDWLRREIEAALESRRNVVPLMLEGFDMGMPGIADQLTDKLSALKQYNALPVPVEYFMEAMARLRERHLNVALDAVTHPASLAAAEAARQDQVAANRAPTVEEPELSAQQWFERGVNASEPDERLRCYTEAIRLHRDWPNAYNNRGVAYSAKGDLDRALQDFDEAIRRRPDYVHAYNNRATARKAKGDLDRALQDYDVAIRLQPTYARAYYNRGNTRKAKGDLDGALHDYTEAIRLNPAYVAAYQNRGNARKARGDLEGALDDYSEAIRLDTAHARAYRNRGSARVDKGDLEGALDDYDEAIRLEPAKALPYYNRAELFVARRNYAAAITDYQTYLELRGDVRDDRQAEVEGKIRDFRTKLP